MKIALKKGEYLWNNRGFHICDEKGFAVILLEDQEIDVDDDVFENVFQIIKLDREFRNCDPLTGVSLPVPESNQNSEPAAIVLE